MSRLDAHLDAIDRQLLLSLTTDGRATWAELGQQVRLSANSVADRVRRLRREGIISCYRAEIDPVALGKPLGVVSDVKLRDGVERVAFAAGLERIPQVVEAVRLTGEYDYQLRLMVRDTSELEAIVDQLKHDHGVAGVNSRVILRQVQFGTAHLLDADRRR